MIKPLFLFIFLSMTFSISQATTVCAQVLIPMYNPTTNQHQVAKNSCHAAELSTRGFIQLNSNKDKIEDEFANPLSVITDGTYQIERSQPASCNKKGLHCLPSWYLVIQLPLNGCLDTAFVTYTITTNSENNIRIVSISALNVANEKSKSAKCIAAPVATKTIFLGGQPADEFNLKVQFITLVAE